MRNESERKMKPVIKRQTLLCTFYYGIISGFQVHVPAYTEVIIIFNIINII